MTGAPDARLVVYTCIAGAYDDLQPVEIPEPGVRYVCFTDARPAQSTGWEVRPLPRVFGDPVLENRFAKMHPHLLFPEHECSVYIDGSITPKQGVRALAEDALRDHDFALFSHPFRHCVYDEAAECAAIGHGWYGEFARQALRYRDEGMPARAGLFECNILFRRHHVPAVVALMQAWWDEFTHGVRRDQLSLPYVLRKAGVAVRDLGPSRIRDGNPNFAIRMEHNPNHRARDLRGYLNRAMLWFRALPRPVS